MGCIEPNTVVGWFEGSLSSEIARAVNDHVDRCAECRALFVELGRSLSDAVMPARDSSASGGPVTVGDTIGRFVVVEWLGAGGMGIVYGAYDPDLERRVAIKLIHPDAVGMEKDATQRFLREAKTLARVSHPNVVAVHEIGSHRGLLFIAMEYVRGQTLAAWLRGGPRPAREVLAYFLDAARGLSAAHAQRVIHRDFKPSNVLVGADGRVRVTDFGLARAIEDQPSAAVREPRSWAGTPQYMSPEQRRGEAVDVRSDQYSFCVALHEALFGDAPAEEPRKTPSGISARVTAAVARGRSDDPADRFASMDALVHALTPEPPSKRLGATAVAILALGGLLVGALAYGRARTAQAELCSGAERKLAGVWDEDTRKAVRASFRATRVNYADDALSFVERELDAYTARWVRAHRDACEATRVHGEQSEEAMDLRIGCLAGQARDLRALTELFANADARVVERAVDALHASLPRVETCGDVNALRARPRFAGDPSARAEIEAMRSTLSRARALDQAGRYREAKELATPLRDRAVFLGARALEGQAEFMIGRTTARLGDISEGSAALYKAVAAAEAEGDDLEKARALTELTYQLGDRLARYEDAEHVGRIALAVLTRLPEEVELAAVLENHLALAAVGRGRYEEAVNRTERAITLLGRALGPQHYALAQSYNDAAKALYMKGDTERASAASERALSIWRETLGPRHPSLALGLVNVAISERQFRRLAEAEVHAKEGLAIWREALGEEHVNVAFAEGVLSTIFKDQGKVSEALPHATRANELIERLLPEDHPYHVDALDGLGEVLLALGRGAEALALHLRARAICARLSDPPHETSETLLDLGRDYVVLGHAADAIAPLERSRVLRADATGDAVDLADTEILLARALWVANVDRTRARDLAAKAHDTYAARRGYERERQMAEDWLKEM
jgi:serine/threonine protein kinase